VTVDVGILEASLVAEVRSESPQGEIHGIGMREGKGKLVLTRAEMSEDVETLIPFLTLTI